MKDSGLTIRKKIKQILRTGIYGYLMRYRSYRTLQIAFFAHRKIFGLRVRADASTVCQLRCPACSTAAGKIARGTIGRGQLKARHFRRLLRENPLIKRVELSNWGEIFLNPELSKIMKIAHEGGVRLTALNGVNLNTVKPRTLEDLVRYKFRALSVSIDGASPETYPIYRVNGDFNRVIENIKLINKFKKKYDSPYPRLTWQFVIFGHNEHELSRAREMASELGMKLKPKLNHTPGLYSVKDEEFVRREGGFGVASRDEFRYKTKTEYSFPCIQLWSNPQINWDGKLLGCCVNKWGHFGKAFREPMADLLKSERYVYAKRMILGLLPPRRDIPCVKCKTYWRLNPNARREAPEIASAVLGENAG